MIDQRGAGLNKGLVLLMSESVDRCLQPRMSDPLMVLSILPSSSFTLPLLPPPTLEHIIQHLLQLRPRDPIPPLPFHHPPDNLPDLLLGNLLHQLPQQLHVDGEVLVVVQFVHGLKGEDVQEGDAQGEDAGFVGEGEGALGFQVLEVLWRVVELGRDWLLL